MKNFDYGKATKELDFSEFKAIFEQLDNVKNSIAPIKQEFISRLAHQMEAQVRALAYVRTGKVASWQAATVGKYSGYAAVRPKTGLFVATKNFKAEIAKKGKGKGKRIVRILSGAHYRVRAVTNAVDLGHDIRGPSGQAERYTPRIFHPIVEGKHFYRSAQGFVDSLCESHARVLADDIAKEIERGLSK
ncbi:MAG: hypothetical protein IKM84_04560 [Oscillospiraceae bacterium]|nr:hypothetical protein [Oscillospiraceae bacterium]